MDDRSISGASSAIVERWDRLRPLPGGGALFARGEIEADRTGPAPMFEFPFFYSGSPMATTRHASLESAVTQSAHMKRILDERGWQRPAQANEGRRDAS